MVVSWAAATSALQNSLRNPVLGTGSPGCSGPILTSGCTGRQGDARDAHANTACSTGPQRWHREGDSDEEKPGAAPRLPSLAGS